MSDPITLNGSSIRLSREAMGWSQNELASWACLSVKQVRQLEEGGSSSFYSENVKITAARKVAGILGLKEDDLLLRPVSEESEKSLNSQNFEQTLQTAQQGMVSGLITEARLQEEHQNASGALPVSSHAAPIDNVQSAGSSEHSLSDQNNGLDSSHNELPSLSSSDAHVNPIVPALKMRSEVLHFLAQPPEQLDEEVQDRQSAEQSSLDSEHQEASFVPTQVGASNTDLHSDGSAASDSESAHHDERSTHSIEHHEHAELAEHAPDASSIGSQAESINEASGADLSKAPEAETVAQTSADTSAQSSTASNFFKIVILFLFALGIAAYFAQKANDERAAEPAPQLQTFPDAVGTSSPTNTPPVSETPSNSTGVVGTSNSPTAQAGAAPTSSSAPSTQQNTLKSNNSPNQGAQGTQGSQGSQGSQGTASNGGGANKSSVIGNGNGNVTGAGTGSAVSGSASSSKSSNGSSNGSTSSANSAIPNAANNATGSNAPNAGPAVGATPGN